MIKKKSKSKPKTTARPQAKVHRRAALCSAVFTPDGDGREIKWKTGSVSVWNGSTKDEKRVCAMRMVNRAGKVTRFLLSENATIAVAVLLTGHMPNAVRSHAPNENEETNEQVRVG